MIFAMSFAKYLLLQIGAIVLKPRFEIDVVDYMKYCDYY